MKRTSLFILLLILIGNFLGFGVVSGSEEWEERPMIYGTTSLAIDIDPHRANDKASQDMIGQIMEGLFSNNLNHPEGALQPQLANNFGIWEVGEMGFHGIQWKYTVQIRQGVTFHDGSLFGPDDVVFSFDRLTSFLTSSNPPPFADLYKPMANDYPITPFIFNRTQLLDDSTVQFILNYKIGSFEALLCHSGSVIMPNHEYSMTDYMNQYIDILIGTGPYAQVSNSDDLSEFAYWDDYYGGSYGIQSPDIHEMQWKLYEDVTRLNQAFLEGEIDSIHEIHTDFLDSYLESEYHDVEDRLQRTDASYLGFNCEEIDINTREAMQYALNYTYINEELGQGEIKMMTSVVPYGILYHDPTIIQPTMNLTKARKYILTAIEAGELALNPPIIKLDELSPDHDWESLSLVSYSYVYSAGNAMQEGIGELAKANFAKIGIKLIVSSLSYGEFLDHIGDGSAHVFILEKAQDYNDPSNYLNNFFTSTSKSNKMRINSSELDLKMNEALAETNQTLREKYYHELQQIVVDLAPCALLYTKNPRLVYSTGCKNMAPSSMDKLYFSLWSFDYSQQKMSIFPPNFVIYLFLVLLGILGSILVYRKRELLREKNMKNKEKILEKELDYETGIIEKNSKNKEKISEKELDYETGIIEKNSRNKEKISEKELDYETGIIEKNSRNKEKISEKELNYETGIKEKYSRKKEIILKKISKINDEIKEEIRLKNMERKVESHIKEKAEIYKFMEELDENFANWDNKDKKKE